MSKVRKILILANGSISVTEKKPNKSGYFGFFSLSNMATWLMYDPNNFISQLAKRSEEEHTLILDGPGTDITEENGSLFKSIGALVDGHIGRNGVSASLEKIKQFIIYHAEEAKEADETLVICGIGWSRGGFVLTQMQEWLEKKSMRCEIEIEAIQLHLIDTVLGGPTDRWRYFFTDRKGKQNVPVNISVHNYLSDTGNLNAWESVLKYLPERCQINTPFFSGLIDTTRNTTYTLNDKQYVHKNSSWLLPTSHEALVGKSRNQIGEWAGQIVLADIVRHVIGFSFKIDEDWVNDTIETGQTALEELRQSDLLRISDRKFLDFRQPDTTLFGRGIPLEEDYINPFHTMSNFSNS
ncbi:hypothetical protein Lnau_0794 [Legionella nautarum]|uniref:DUF2235 domain-containing protein n=1 Tax=Legionella nautarum TaxID=45070 RepID=A0A0W0WU22_9GAMM|nr:hypothetical protein [Legionella nautarum]KTD35810.1 hypothetical protein Lnau_0794 [Legionella nautarum]